MTTTEPFSIDKALGGDAIRYEASIALHRAAVRLLPGGVSSNFRLGGRPVPLFFEHGSGSRLWDVDGNSYVDYALGMGPAILGHAPSAVVEAVQASLQSGQLFAGQTRLELELASTVCGIVPCAEQVRFGMSGSEMVQAALRVARAATGRSQVIKFEGHYHGWFDSILVSVAPPIDDVGPYRRPRPHFPSRGQIPPTENDLVVLPWNDLDVVKAHLEDAHDRVAAMIMEPILCNTCVILPSEGYLQGIRELCDRYGIVLIFDEVITGFRVSLGGAQELLGVTPDLAVFAKAIGGGFPIAAIAGRKALMEQMVSGGVVHGGTYNASLVSVAAALATIHALSDTKTNGYARMTAVGDRLMAGLRSMGDSYGLRVQGLPMAFNTSFPNDSSPIVDYRSYARCDLARQHRFLDELQRRGVRPTSRGTWFLSTAHRDVDIDETLEAAAGALAASA